MSTRAAVCIGVDRPGSMLPLRAAAQGARDFSVWAREQGCVTTLLDSADVSLREVLRAVRTHVEQGTFEQLIVYFAGHGVLSAPGAEYWLLSDAPENANEAVNLFRSIEDARNCGIPHVVFVSDACRSSVKGPPLSAILGGTIFPNAGYRAQRGEVDVFYATRPGDPAWELPMDEAGLAYRGLFTEALLRHLRSPSLDLIEELGAETPSYCRVITSRKLKPVLERLVPLEAAKFDVRVRQIPEIRVETALPKHLGVVPLETMLQLSGPPEPSEPTLRETLESIREDRFGNGIRAQLLSLPLLELKLRAQISSLRAAESRTPTDSGTGFALFGARAAQLDAAGWNVETAPSNGFAHFLLSRTNGRSTLNHSAVLQFESAAGPRGTVLAIVENAIGAVVVDDGGRVLSVNYLRAAPGFVEPEALSSYRARAAIEAREGCALAPTEPAERFLEHIRLDGAIDFTLALYAAYAYAQAGRHTDVVTLWHAFAASGGAVSPFDLALLARANRPPPSAVDVDDVPVYAPFVPMLATGWSTLNESDAMFVPIHAALRPHRVPALWTTLTAEGAGIALRELQARFESNGEDT